MAEEALKNFKGARDGNAYLVNLIDSPGHVDFSSEVTAALRITDGALVVVDCVEGVCVQTETVLRQALGERIRPVLTVNKMDRCFLELQLEGEEAYTTYLRVIENANVILATYQDDAMGDLQVRALWGGGRGCFWGAGRCPGAGGGGLRSLGRRSGGLLSRAVVCSPLLQRRSCPPLAEEWLHRHRPCKTTAATVRSPPAEARLPTPRPSPPAHPQVYPDKGTVSFSAGLHGWAFTLTTFAQMYAAKFGTEESKMMEKLWGDNFFDPATKKWTKKQTDSPTCVRGFVQFCYNPIKQVIDLAMNDNKDKLFALLEKVNCLDKLKSEDKDLTGGGGRGGLEGRLAPRGGLGGAGLGAGAVCLREEQGS
jgi:translation elongation factor EF-G